MTGQTASKPLMADVKRLHGTRTIQRVFRGHLGRSQAKALKQQKLKHESAIKVQALTRGYLARKSYKRERAAKVGYSKKNILRTNII